MYERVMLMFLYADSPVHFGAGVSLGAVDLPVQRERHTQYPMAQGSGLKGALRHHLTSLAQGDQDRKKIGWVFGPDGSDEGRPQDHAGAAAFGDGKLLLFPARSLVGTFAYCTSTVALARLRRDAELMGQRLEWTVPPEPPDGTALAPAGSRVTGDGVAVVEDFDVAVDQREDVSRISAWIADRVVPAGEGFAHFHERIGSHSLILHDGLFAHLTRLATVVEPHVRIDDTTGTASERGFFYAEHLPPDTVLWSLVGLAGPRATTDDRQALEKSGLVNAAAAGEYLKEKFDGKAVQVGADATTGRGLVHVRFA